MTNAQKQTLQGLLINWQNSPSKVNEFRAIELFFDKLMDKAANEALNILARQKSMTDEGREPHEG